MHYLADPARQPLVLKYVTDVVPNLQTVVWLGLSESFVHTAQPGTVVCPRALLSFVGGRGFNIFKTKRDRALQIVLMERAVNLT